jgi:hypothetical protein
MSSSGYQEAQGHLGMAIHLRPVVALNIAIATQELRLQGNISGRPAWSAIHGKDSTTVDQRQVYATLMGGKRMALQVSNSCMHSSCCVPVKAPRSC